MAKKVERICCKCGSTVSYTKRTKPKVCPVCKEPDYIKPPTETVLFLLQKKYLEEVDPEKKSRVLGEMFLVLKDYAGGKIKKLLKGIVHYEDTDVEEKASDSANCLIEYYLTKPNFVIESSFGGYLEWQVKSTLYNSKNKKADQVESLNAFIKGTKKEVKELNNFTPLLENSLDYDYLYDAHKKQDIQDGVMSIIQTSVDEIRKQISVYDSLATIVSIKNYIMGTGRAHRASFYQYFGKSNVQYFTDNIMMFVKQSIKENQ